MLEYLGCSLLTTTNIVYKDQHYNKPQCGYYIQQNISMCNKTETDSSKYTYWDPIILNSIYRILRMAVKSEEQNGQKES